MKVLYVARGLVQNVGYRQYVMGIASKHRIKGTVRNVSDGSVEILAIGEESSLEKFEEEIKIDKMYGPQVKRLERIPDSHPNFPKEAESEYYGFFIKGDKRL